MEKFKRPKYLNWLNVIGAAFCVASIIVGGWGAPAIGFFIVVTILIILEIPKVEIKLEYIPIIKGSIRYGGIRRGVFINECFTLAVFYLCYKMFMVGNIPAGYATLLLGIGIIFTDVASEIFLHRLEKEVKNVSKIEGI